MKTQWTIEDKLNHYKKRVPVFSKSINTLFTVNPSIKEESLSGRGWKGRYIENLILSYAGSRLNTGKDILTISATKVRKDAKEQGIEVTVRTISRTIAKLKKEGLKVEEQGYCIRNKEGRPVAGKLTIFKVTEKLAIKLKEISKGFFAGINRIKEKVRIAVEGGYAEFYGEFATLYERTMEKARKAQEEYNRKMIEEYRERQHG